MSLYNKYRPSSLEMVCGQDHVKRIISSQVKSGDLVHAYLFVGPAGVGKTSMARIMAAMVNCSTGMTMTPAPDDPFVSKIMSGRCQTDVLELDAATSGLIENIREIRENAKFPPLEMRRKVYIIDECHRLSSAAWEGLLKIIEEPPPHVLFILCTTNGNAVTETVKSRCMPFDFRCLSVQDIGGYLKKISKSEKMDVDEDALLLVAKASRGSMRKAISSMEKFKHIDGRITAKMIGETLGVADKRLARNFVNAIIGAKFVDGLEASSTALSSGVLPGDLLSEIANYCHDTMLTKSGSFDMESHGYTKSEAEDVRRTAASLVTRVGRDFLPLLTSWIKILNEIKGYTVFNVQPQFQIDVTYVEMFDALRIFDNKENERRRLAKFKS